ncbi:MAG: ABC transporter substrate-binding protein [Trueperaceae bacterium]|nr:ABC transporter substrate-binding protein [Trueperaceae bacterium]
MTRLLFAALAVSLSLTLGSVSVAQDAPEPVYGGSVTVAIVAEPPGWDPTVSTSQEIPRVVYHNVYEGLVRLNRNGDIVPALAESWQVSEDGLTWTFQLRDGVVFHDGSSLDAADVVAKFERATDPDSGHTNPAYYESIETVSAEGSTVTFTLNEPNTSLLYNLARPDSIIYPPELADTQRSQPIGTGPFRFAEYVEGSEVRLERFEDYYLDGVPYLDSVTFRIIGDPNTQFAALRAGDIDLIGVALSPENALQVQNDPNLKLSQGTATTEITLALNNRLEPLSNPLVRQAITHAIDKSVIVDGAMFGFGTVIGSHVSPAEPYFVDLSNTYPYNPERARELLAEAGYPDGFSLRFELPEPYNIERRSGQVIAQQLTEVGIEVDLSIVEWGTWIQRIFLGADYDMTIIGHSEPRDINIYANPDYYYGYDNAEVQALIEAAEQAPSDLAQNEIYARVAEIIAQDAVNVWVFSPPYLVAAANDVYGFWEDQPTPAIDMTEVYRAP